MDNEYFAAWIVKERLHEMQAAARRDALLRTVPSRHRRLRVTLGTLLIRVGAWLSSEGADVGAPSEAGESNSSAI